MKKFSNVYNYKYYLLSDVENYLLRAQLPLFHVLCNNKVNTVQKQIAFLKGLESNKVNSSKITKLFRARDIKPFILLNKELKEKNIPLKEFLMFIGTLSQSINKFPNDLCYLLSLNNMNLHNYLQILSTNNKKLLHILHSGYFIRFSHQFSNKPHISYSNSYISRLIKRDCNSRGHALFNKDLLVGDDNRAVVCIANKYQVKYYIFASGDKHASTILISHRAPKNIESMKLNRVYVNKNYYYSTKFYLEDLPYKYQSPKLNKNHNKYDSDYGAWVAAYDNYSYIKKDYILPRIKRPKLTLRDKKNIKNEIQNQKQKKFSHLSMIERRHPNWSLKEVIDCLIAQLGNKILANKYKHIKHISYSDLKDLMLKRHKHRLIRIRDDRREIKDTSYVMNQFEHISFIIESHVHGINIKNRLLHNSKMIEKKRVNMCKSFQKIIPTKIVKHRYLSHRRLVKLTSRFYYKDYNDAAHTYDRIRNSKMGKYIQKSFNTHYLLLSHFISCKNRLFLFNEKEFLLYMDNLIKNKQIKQKIQFELYDLMKYDLNF